MTIMFAHSTHKPMISTRGSHYQGANTDYCAPDLANAYLRTTHIVDHFMLMFLILVDNDIYIDILTGKLFWVGVKKSPNFLQINNVKSFEKFLQCL